MEKKHSYDSRTNLGKTKNGSNRSRVCECEENGDHPHFQLDPMREFRYMSDITNRCSYQQLFNGSGFTIRRPMVPSWVKTDRLVMAATMVPTLVWLTSRALTTKA